MRTVVLLTLLLVLGLLMVATWRGHGTLLRTLNALSTGSAS